MKHINHPGHWQHFVRRNDNKNLTTEQARQKYMKEQFLFEQSVTSITSATVAASAAGGGGTLGSAPYVIQDADAQSFITSANITNEVEQMASDALIVNFKSAGLWSKMTHIYPLVGGTASSHKFNIKDLRDLDAAYRLSFYGGWTHNSNGITGNGTNTYADTYSKTARTVGVYSRVSTTVGTLIGQAYTAIDGDGYQTNPSGLIIKGNLTLSRNVQINTSTAPYTKMYTVVDSDSTTANSVNIYRNGIDIQALHSSNASPWSKLVNYVIGAERITDYDENFLNPSTTIQNFSNANIAFACFSDDMLTAQEALDLDIIVQSFQTTLGR